MRFNLVRKILEAAGSPAWTRRRPLVYSRIDVAGLDLTLKFREQLGGGEVASAELVAEKLAPFDGDSDGALTEAELAEFFAQHKLGGAWYSKALAGQLWRLAAELLGAPPAQLSIKELAESLHNTMKKEPRGEERYILTPGAVRGTEPRVPVGKQEAKPSLLSGAPRNAPRAKPAAPRARPRRPAPRARRPMPRKRP